MNIVIGILSVIDTILIYVVDVKMGDVKAEVLFDLFGSLVIAFIWVKIEDEDFSGKIKATLKWTSMIYLISVLCYMIFAFIKKDFKYVQKSCSPVIPLFVSYYVILVKQKIEEQTWRIK